MDLPPVYMTRRSASELFSFALLLLFFAVPAQAAPVLTWCLDHLPPRQLYLNSQTPSGPMVDFMQELAKRSGFSIRFSPPMPSVRCLKQMEQGKADLMSGLLFKPERAEYMEFLQLDTAKTDVLFVHKNQTFESAQQLYKRKIALAENNNYSSDFLRNLQKTEVDLIWVNNMEAALALLALKQVDLAAGSMHLTQLLISKNSRFKTLLTQNSWQFSSQNPEYVYLTLSKRSAHSSLLPIIKHQVQQMQLEGKINFYAER